MTTASDLEPLQQASQMAIWRLTTHRPPLQQANQRLTVATQPARLRLASINSKDQAKGRHGHTVQHAHEQQDRVSSCRRASLRETDRGAEAHRRDPGRRSSDFDVSYLWRRWWRHAAGNECIDIALFAIFDDDFLSASDSGDDSGTFLLSSQGPSADFDAIQLDGTHFDAAQAARRRRQLLLLLQDA